MVKNRQSSKWCIAALLPFVVLAGCSSWGGKMRNTEGVRYYSNGQYDEALESFQTASRLNPEDPEVYYNLASTYQQQATRYNQPALLTQAENYYRQCLDKNPNSETTVCCYRGLATVLNQKNEPSEAMSLLRTWEERNPSSVEPKLEIAYLLEAQGANQDAAAALEKIAAYAPNDYRAYYKLGLVREKLGQDDAALTQLQTSLRLKPNDTEIAQRIEQLETKMRGGATQVAGNGPVQGNAPMTAGAPKANENWKQPEPGNSNVAATAPKLDDPITGGTSAQFPQTQATETGPAYGSPAAGSTGVSPIGSVPPEPAAPTPPAPPTTYNAIPASPNDAFPDGTGANPFNLVPPASGSNETTTAPATLTSVPQPASNAGIAPTLTASAPTTPTATGNRKQRIGESPNSPPSISVGAPF